MKSNTRLLIGLGVAILCIVAVTILVRTTHKTNTNESAESNPSLTSNDVRITGSACDGELDIIKVTNIAIRNGVPEAEGYYKRVKSEYNNFAFDETIKCSLSIEKITVLAARDSNPKTPDAYDFTSFRKDNTWKLYMNARTAKQDYVTNVFRVSKSGAGYALTEEYQE